MVGLHCRSLCRWRLVKSHTRGFVSGMKQKLTPFDYRKTLIFRDKNGMIQNEEITSYVTENYGPVCGIDIRKDYNNGSDCAFVNFYDNYSYMKAISDNRSPYHIGAMISLCNIKGAFEKPPPFRNVIGMSIEPEFFKHHEMHEIISPIRNHLTGCCTADFPYPSSRELHFFSFDSEEDISFLMNRCNDPIRGPNRIPHISILHNRLPFRIGTTLRIFPSPGNVIEGHHIQEIREVFSQYGEIKSFYQDHEDSSFLLTFVSPNVVSNLLARDCLLGSPRFNTGYINHVLPASLQHVQVFIDNMRLPTPAVIIRGSFPYRMTPMKYACEILTGTLKKSPGILYARWNTDYQGNKIVALGVESWFFAWDIVFGYDKQLLVNHPRYYSNYLTVSRNNEMERFTSSFSAFKGTHTKLGQLALGTGH